MEEADDLCGRIGIIDFGKIQVIDTPKSMKRAIGNEIISFNLVDGKANQDTLIDQINNICLLYTSPSPRDRQKSRMPSSA